MSDGIKVFELAKELNIKALDLIDKIKPLKLQIKNHMSDLSHEQVQQIKDFLDPPKTPGTSTETKKVAVKRRATAVTNTEEVASKAPVKTGVAATRASSGESKKSGLVKKRPVIIRRDVSAPGTITEKRTVLVKGVPTVEEKTTNLESEPGYEEELNQGPEFSYEGEDTENLESTDLEMSAAELESDGSAEEIVDETSEKTEEVRVQPVKGTASEEPAEAPVAKKPKYSVIRVVSAEPAKRSKPLIVEEASAVTKKTLAPKTFADPELARSGSELLALEEIENENRKRKGGGLGAKLRSSTTDAANFKSTDYLRRERVYQPKKKKLSIGKTSSKLVVPMAAAHKRVVEIDSEISVELLAREMNVKVYEVAKKLRSLGVDRPEEAETFQDWILDFDTAQLVSGEFNYDVKDVSFSEQNFIKEALNVEQEDSQLSPRAPVVTIMGHVDHGKTSLLDLIRRSRVAAGEAGGITQHIGAYMVNVQEAVDNLAAAQQTSGKAAKTKSEKKEPKKEKKNQSQGSDSRWVTFLDTPGHAIFTEMRSRGAKCTDIVILVVAASEGVMPQTREAAEHAKAAGVPVIVAMNKMDLPEANPDRIRQQLSEIGIISEDWGGDAIFVPVSAKTGMGVDKLLEMILLQAELMELKSRSEGFAEGTIVEAKLDKGRGPLATVLVQSGELKQGQYVVAGTQVGKVRALINDRGQQIKVAGPSTPVEILGLSGVPEAGDSLNSFDDEAPAKELAEHRKQIREKQNLATSGGDDVFTLMSVSGNLKELPVIIKADVKGSAEAIQAALLKLPSEKVKIKILSASVGAVGESDVLLASASKALVVGFNVRPDSKVQAEAEKRKVQVRTYTIIYELIEDITRAMEGLLDPTLRETILGEAEVRNVFNITKTGTVAGCMVVKGKVTRSSSVRVIRDGRVVYTGKVSGLKRFKDDAKEVAEGYECGVSVENFNDIKPSDRLEFFAVESVTATLGSPRGSEASA